MQVTILDHKGFIHFLSLVISLPSRQKDKKLQNLKLIENPARTKKHINVTV